MNHPHNMAPSMYYDANVTNRGRRALMRRDFDHEYLLDCSAIKPSRFDKIRSMETMAQTCANPQKQSTAAEIIAKCEAMLEPAPFSMPYFEFTNECWSDPRAPMRNAEAMMQALLALTPQQEAEIQRAMERTVIQGLGLWSAPPASITADFAKADAALLGTDWGAGAEPEPKDTPERARERSEGLCGWKGGVRDSDRQGIAAARVDEDWNEERAKALWALKSKQVFFEAPPAKPSAGLLTIAEPTHRFGGWGA